MLFQKLIQSTPPNFDYVRKDYDGDYLALFGVENYTLIKTKQKQKQ